MDWKENILIKRTSYIGQHDPHWSLYDAGGTLYSTISSYRAPGESAAHSDFVGRSVNYSYWVPYPAVGSSLQVCGYSTLATQYQRTPLGALANPKSFLFEPPFGVINNFGPSISSARSSFIYKPPLMDKVIPRLVRR